MMHHDFDHGQQHQPPQLGQSRRYMGFHGTLTDTQSLGYLLVFESFYAAHGEYLTPLRRHLVDMLVNNLHEFLAVKRLLDVGIILYLKALGRPPVLSYHALQGVEGGVFGHHIYVGVERFDSGYPVALYPQLHENVLRYVLGLVFIAAKAKDKLLHPWIIACENHVESFSFVMGQRY